MSIIYNQLTNIPNNKLIQNNERIKLEINKSSIQKIPCNQRNTKSVKEYYKNNEDDTVMHIYELF